MGITRDTLHKRRLTGGKKAIFRKKRKYYLGRQPANTKLGSKVVRPVRVRGGNFKFRALRLDSGNFSWGSEAISRKTRIVAVVYNASNNELVRTNTLVKGCIIQIDATPFRQWYSKYYGVEIGKKKKDEEEEEKVTSKKGLEKQAKRRENKVLDKALLEQFSSGKLLARVSSRPGQCGRCDGYILEGKELEFYQRQMQRRKKTGK